MASTIPRPGSAPCCSLSEEFDKQVLSEKIKYPLSQHDAIQPQNTQSFSPSNCTAPMQNLQKLNSKNHGLKIYDLGNEASQTRYVSSPTYQNSLIHANMHPTPCQQMPGNQFAGVQNYANLYLTRSIYDPNVQLPNSDGHSKRMPTPSKQQPSYGKISRKATASTSRMSSIVHDEMDLSIFKEDNTILQVPRKMAMGQSSRIRSPLKVEEANELSSSFKSDEEGIQSRDSLQTVNRRSRSVNDNGTRVFHRNQNNGGVGLDIRSLCRVLKYIMVLLVGFIVGAGFHALVKCWTKGPQKK